MLIILGIAVLQAAYSFLSTCRVNDAVADDTVRYVVTAALSDLAKYSITAGIAFNVALNADWITIVTTVIGGIVGNGAGHIYKMRQRVAEIGGEV